MPPPEIITEEIKKLPVISSGTIAKDNEIWEGEEMGAHFKLTKESLAAPPLLLTFWALSISGTAEGKKKIVADFNQALGKPTTQGEEGRLTISLWLVPPKTSTSTSNVG